MYLNSKAQGATETDRSNKGLIHRVCQGLLGKGFGSR